MKLRDKILLPVSAILFLGMLSITIILFLNSKEEIQRNIVQEMNQLSEMLIRDLDDYQRSSLQDVEIFSVSQLYTNIFLENDENSIKNANRELREIQQRRSEYESIGITDGTGLVIASENEDLIGNVNIGNRDYFLAAMKGSSAAGEITISKVTGNPVIGVAAPIVVEGTIRGTCFVVIDQTKFNTDYIDPVKIGNEGFAMMVDGKGNIIAYPDKSEILNSNTYDYDFGREMMSLEKGVMEYIFNGNSRTSSVITSSRSDWKIIVTAENDDIYAGVNNLLKLSILITIFVFIIGVAIIVFLSKSIVKPIRINSEYAEKLADGDLTFDFNQDLLKNRDESGDLAKSFYKVIEKLRTVVFDVRSASEQVGQGSQQLANTSEEISQGASEQASTSEEVSSAMEQMSSTIAQNSENATLTAQIATKVAEDAEDGGKAVQEAVDAMVQITEKIAVIEDISRNTNLLSLNAAIEAARAGEHGKGFAVVAGEVKKLAVSSQSAAKEIQELAKISSQKADNAGRKIKAIIPDVKKTADLVKEILESSLEQSTGADQVNKMMLQLDTVIQGNASAAEESASMSEELSGQSEKLIEMIRFFKVNNIHEDQKLLAQTDENPLHTVARVSPVRVKNTLPMVDDDLASGFEEY